MALSNFFRINLPYGIKKNSNDEWVAFNREYKPLGWNDSFNNTISLHDDNLNSTYPIFTKYKGLTEKKLSSIVKDDEKYLKFDKDGKIIEVFFYNDGNNPSNEQKNWIEYIEKLKKVSNLLPIR